MVNKNSAIRARKAQQIQRIYELLGKYEKIVAVTLENVGSLQCQQIRKAIRSEGGILVIGKNTVIKKAIALRMKKFDTEDEDFEFLRETAEGQAPMPELESLYGLIKEKIGFVFTNGAVHTLKAKIEEFKVQAPAKVGQISNLDVIIPPGPTGMDPSQISFFHALQISTKIQKGQIEITKDYQVCTTGKKIGNSEVSLLQKMNLKPFSYQMEVFACYTKGTILSKEVVSLSPDDIIAKFAQGVKFLAAISLETGYQTQASIPYAITNAFKNLAAIGMEVDYKFKQLASAASAAPAQAAVTTSAAQPAAAAKVEEKVEEPEEDMDMGGLFD